VTDKETIKHLEDIGAKSLKLGSNLAKKAAPKAEKLMVKLSAWLDKKLDQTK